MTSLSNAHLFAPTLLPTDLLTAQHQLNMRESPDSLVRVWLRETNIASGIVAGSLAVVYAYMAHPSAVKLTLKAKSATTTSCHSLLIMIAAFLLVTPFSSVCDEV